MTINTRTLRRAAVAAFAVPALAALSACGQSAAGGGSEPTLNLGIATALTGTSAEFGGAVKAGAELAAEEINNGGGVAVNGKNVKIKVSFCDTQLNGQKAATCGKRLSSQEKDIAVFAGTSIEAFPLAGFNTSSTNKFIVVGTSASPKFTAMGNPLVVRLWYDVNVYMPNFSKELYSYASATGSKGTKVGIMESKDEFGQAWATKFSEGWKDAGGEAPVRATYAATDTDLYNPISTLLKAKPDYIAAPGLCSSTSKIVKQAKEMQFKGRFIFQSGCTAKELATLVDPQFLEGSAFEGTKIQQGGSELKAFNEAFQKKYSKEPTTDSTVTAQWVNWMAAAAAKAGTATDVEKIRAAMASTLEGDYNYMGAKDLQESGQIYAPIHVEYVPSSDGKTKAWN